MNSKASDVITVSTHCEDSGKEEEKKDSAQKKVNDIKELLELPSEKAKVENHQRKEFYAVIEDDSYLKQFEGEFNTRQMKFKR